MFDAVRENAGKQGMSFEIIEHTADTGIRVRAPDLPSLLSEAMRGMFTLITDPDQVDAVRTHTIHSEGIDETDLVINTMRETVYRFSAENWLLKDFVVDSMNDLKVTGRIRGETLDVRKHPIRYEIKAVTYAGGEIRKTRDGLEITVIFDV